MTEDRFDRRRELIQLRLEREQAQELIHQQLERERADERSRARRRRRKRLIALVALAAAAISLAVALVVTLTGNGSSAASLRSMLASLPPGRYDPAGSYPGPDDDPVHPPNVILSHGNTYVLIPDFGYQFDFLASAHYGFFAYGQWLKRGDLKDRAAVLRIANWLVRKQQVDGRWLYEFPVSLDGATIGIPRPSAAAQGEAMSLLERAFQLQHNRRYLVRARTQPEGH